MIISRERHLDDTRRFHLTLELVTRTGAMHSVLTELEDEARLRIGDILVTALDAIGRELSSAVARHARTDTSSFGCGT